MPLLGPREKGELETLILERFNEHYDRHGPESLLAPGLVVGVSSKGVQVAPGAHAIPGALVCVEIRTLFTALCYAAANEGVGLPRPALKALATEATSAAAVQINRLVPD